MVSAGRQSPTGEERRRRAAILIGVHPAAAERCNWDHEAETLSSDCSMIIRARRSPGHNRQVLAVFPPGDAWDILNELRWGVVADPDVTDIGRAIERLTSLPTPGREADPEGKYDRVALAGRSADCLRQATEGAPGERAARGTG